jgi:uncharacterized protein (TIRG00374 family)
MSVPRAIDPAQLGRHLVRGAGCASLATVLVLLVTTGRATLTHLREFPPAVLPLLLLMVMLSWGCNAARVRLMARAAGHRLGRRQALTITLAMELGNNATPAGVGGTLLRLSLLHRAGVPFSTASGLLAQGALVDALVMLPFGIAGLLVLLERRLPGLGIDRAFTLGMAVTVIAMLIVFRVCVRRLRTRRAQGVLQRSANASAVGRRLRLAARLRLARRVLPGGLRRARATLDMLWRERKTALIADVPLAAFQHASRYLVLPVIIWSFGFPASALELFAGQGLLFTLSLLLVVPGGGGSVELLSAVLLPGVVPAGIVGIVVLVWRFFTYHLYLLGGAVALLFVLRESLRPVSATRVPCGRHPDDGPACDTAQSPSL